MFLNAPMFADNDDRFGTEDISLAYPSIEHPSCKSKEFRLLQNECPAVVCHEHRSSLMVILKLIE